MNKYIFVTGGVCSSLGKGLASASLGSLLEGCGLRVRMIKIDPYLNVDAGTMSPYQHGEVYVTDDGAETDLDLGNYARFTSSPLGAANSITTGQIYQEVIRKERKGDYLGKCVQVVPHITDEIKRRIYALGDKPDVDVTIVEVGGTVGDIESIPFLEGIRQIIHERGRRSALSVHLTLVPTLTGGEVKTKPTQHSVKDMQEIGIQPEVLLCRLEEPLPEDLRRKISQFTNVDHDAVFSAHDVHGSIYEIPVIYGRQGLHKVVAGKLDLILPVDNGLSSWEKVVDTLYSADREVTIAMVGKYIELGDSYKSVDEAVYHGGIANGVRVKLVKVDSETLPESDKDLDEVFDGVDGILVPGGFGSRGIEGMIRTVRYAREQKVPYLGLCLGLQVMVVEFARNVLGLEKADSAEFKPDGPENVITLLEDQVDVTAYGGTMRLGLSETVAKEGSRLHAAYGDISTWERHRHRYEVSNRHRPLMEEAGLVVSGLTPDGALVEAVEWDADHPWSVAVQSHPEFTSQPGKAGPLFRDFVRAAAETGDAG